MLARMRRAAQAAPSRLAYIGEDGGLTYGALWAQAERAAGLLRRQGRGPVLVYGDKTTGMAVSLLACLLAGRAYVPLDPRMPQARREQIRAQTGASLALANAPLVLNGAACCTLEELAQFAARPVQAQTGDTAYILFTSGSTGAPKGVPISRQNLAGFAAWIGGLEPLRRYQGVRVLDQASFSFDLSAADFYYALCGGHTLAGLPRSAQEDCGRLFRALEALQPDVMAVTPTFLRLCLLEPSFRAEQYPGLRCVYLCGERLEPGLVRRLFAAFPGVRVLNAYGPTEATSAVCAVEITRAMAEAEPLLPVGRLDGSAAAISVENGEIVLRGGGVFGGYLDGAAGGHWRENGVDCYRTGDRGFVRDGRLYCTGRTDRQIKYKGYRIELDDIEANLNRIAGVRQSAVVASRGPDGAVKRLQAFAELEEGTDLDAVRRELARRLPPYMVPGRLHSVEALPVNANHKIDRRRLGEE